MRPLLLLLLCAPATSLAAEASVPVDPDLEVGVPCPGGPAVADLIAALPTRVKELAVLWPRAGCTRDDARPAARFTLVNHQGEILTLTAVLEPEDPPPSPRGYRLLLDDPIPRAELELVPSPEHPAVLVRIAGQPTTPREGLEGPGDFLDLGSLVAALDGLR